MPGGGDGRRNGIGPRANWGMLQAATRDMGRILQPGLAPIVVSTYNHELFATCLGNQHMANSAQARKRARQSLSQRAHNASLRSKLRTAIKAVRKAVATGDKAAAQAVFQQSMSVIDSVADKNIVHKNAAARHKSRLSAAVKAI